MPAYYKGQPVFGIMGSGGNEFIKWNVKAYIDTSVKNIQLFHDGYYYLIYSSMVMRSKDFIVYEPVPIGSGSATPQVIIHDGTRFVLKASNQIWTSEDGTTWTKITNVTGLNSNNNYLAYFKGHYISWKVSSSGWAPSWSLDLKTWKGSSSPGSLSSSYVITDDILVSPKYYPSSAGQFIYTEDGETFAQSNTIDSIGNMYSMGYNNGIFLAADTSANILKSTDGKNWTVVGKQPDYYYNLRVFKDRFLLSPYTSYTEENYVYTALPAFISVDGEAWEKLEGSFGYGMDGTVINGKFFCTQPDAYYHLLIGE